MPENNPNHVGLSRRLAAIFYDAMLLFGILFFATLALSVPLNITQEHPLFFLFQIYLVAISFLYFGWFWTHGGQTLGMKTWKIALTNTQQGKVTWNNVFFRFITAIISWLALGCGFWWSLINKQNKTWHDIASRTQLVHLE